MTAGCHFCSQCYIKDVDACLTATRFRKVSARCERIVVAVVVLPQKDRVGYLQSVLFGKVDKLAEVGLCVYASD
uniref:Uncharacterized protein n=1 Tax=Acrobeloides nanus TaxID=290746 RepID=A0A914EE85_9BILA